MDFASNKLRTLWQSVEQNDLDQPILENNGSAMETMEIEREYVFDEDGNEFDTEDPHAEGIGGDLVSAILGIIKGMVGPAILYLPHGFASAGYVMALPIMGITTCLYLYSSSCLLMAWKLEMANDSEVSDDSEMDGDGIHRRRRRTLSYPELARRALGPIGETVVKTGIALMQSGVCLTYLIFVPHNLHVSFHALFGVSASARAWLVVMVLIQIPLSWIRDIRKFTTTNFVANVLILYGLVTCLGYAVEEASAANPDKGHVGSFVVQLKHLSAFESSWFLFIGTSVLLFEGSITLLIPLQEAVESVEERRKFPSVYKLVIMGIIGFYLFFGISCWASFGHDVNTVLTTSLPEGLFATSVQLAYSIAVIFTFPLQNFPALEIACKTLSRTLVDSGYVQRGSWPTQRNVIASSMVILLALVAVSTMDSLDKVVSLMGALLGCPIAFVFPPIIFDRVCQNASPKVRFWNRVVTLMGLIAMVFASIATVAEW